ASGGSGRRRQRRTPTRARGRPAAATRGPLGPSRPAAGGHSPVSISWITSLNGALWSALTGRRHSGSRPGTKSGTRSMRSLSRTVSTSGERPSPEFRASASTLKSLAPISRSMSFASVLGPAGAVVVAELVLAVRVRVPPGLMSLIDQLLRLDVDADALEGLGKFGELGEGGLEVFDDFRSDHSGGGKVVGVLLALVAQPEDVEAGLVSRHQLVVGEAAEPLALLALSSPAGLVAHDEVVEVGSAEGVGLEGEVLIGPQVV